MSTTNHTVNYELSQYIGSDVTSYLSNYNSDMYKIDAQMKVNATDAATAKSDASAAVSAATSAASSASAAVNTANAANTTAEAAQTAAAGAQTAAGAAQTDAAAALRASASNTIGNLAPAYDPTLTYGVGDLVTYVDPETNQGKLYKNIIAIDVPEEFNINKWDDVTVSEVIENQDFSVIKSVTADGVKTYGELCAELFNDFDFNGFFEILETYPSGSIFHYRKSTESSTKTKFVSTGVPSDTQWVVSSIESTGKIDFTIRVSGTITSENRTSTVATSGLTISIIKLL